MGFFSFMANLRNRLLMTFMVLMMFASSKAHAQVGADPPDIEVALPFDLAPIITAVLGLAVLVLILTAGPRISLRFAKKALRTIGNIF